VPPHCYCQHVGHTHTCTNGTNHRRKIEAVDFAKLYTDRKMEVAYPKARLGRTTEEFARRIAKLSLTSTPMDDP